MFALVEGGAVKATASEAASLAHLGAGDMLEVPGALLAAVAQGGLVEWDGDALRVRMPEPVRDGAGIWALFTANEKMAICLSEVPEVTALVKALPFTAETRPSSPWHAAGVQLLVHFGLLTPERAMQVLAFAAPPP